MTDCIPSKKPMIKSTVKYSPGVMNTDLHDVPYRSLLGSLMSISGNTRPDIRAAVIIHSSYTNCYTIAHWNSLKSILRYLKGTVHYRFCYSHPGYDASPFKETEVVLFCDSDWGENKINRRSLSGAITFLYENPICFTCMYQKSVATSTSEAEYYAIAEAIKDGRHIISILSEIAKLSKPTILHCDNLGACFMAENQVNNKRTRHIDIQYHFIREAIIAGEFRIAHVASENNWSDIFTKAEPAKVVFEYFINWIMMKLPGYKKALTTVVV